MSYLRFLGGLAVLAGLAAPALAVGWDVQRRLPRRHPSARVLATIVVAVSVVVLAGQLVGIAGGLRIWPLLGGNAVVALLALVGLRRWAPEEPDGDAEAAPDPAAEGTDAAWGALPRWLIVLAGVAVAGVAVRWLSTTFTVFQSGITDPDSNQYHLPFAAEFARTGFTTRFHPVFPDPIQLFYPANTELLQAIGMESFGSDSMAPAGNGLWCALLLLGAWVAGVRDRVAPLTLLAGAAVIGLPIMTYTNGGTALTDVAMLAGLTMAVGLWRVGAGHLGWTAVAALALGLSVGAKATAMPTAGILLLGMAAVAGRGERVRTALVVAAGTAATCGFWFLRNLVRTGSPLPSVSIPFLPRTPLPVVDVYGTSVSHYLFDLDAWRDDFLPGIRTFFGGPGVYAAVALVVGLAAVWRRRADRQLVALLAAGAIGALSYLFVPAGAWTEDGVLNEFLFTVNLRYLLPALLALGLLGMVALAEAPARVRAAVGVVLGAGVLHGVVVHREIWYPSDRDTALAALAVLAAVGAGAAVRRVPRRWPAVAVPAGGTAAGLLGLLLVVVGVHTDATQLRHRAEAGARRPLFASLAEARPGSHIAHFGLSDNYRLYGPGLHNRVDYLGVKGPHAAFRAPADCAEYIEVLADLDPDYLVLAAPALYKLAPLDLPAWTRTQPGARQLVVDGDYTTFAVQGPYDPARCPAGR